MFRGADLALGNRYITAMIIIAFACLTNCEVSKKKYCVMVGKT